MAASLGTLITGLSIFALAIAAAQIGTAVQKLQENLDEVSRGKEKAPAPGGPPRAMLSGLYPAVSESSRSSMLPGMRWILAGVALGLMGLLFGLIPQKAVVPQPPAELTSLSARVDSLAGDLSRRKTGDSLAALQLVAAPPVAARRSAAPTRVAAAVPPAVVIPKAILPDTTPIRIPGQ